MYNYAFVTVIAAVLLLAGCGLSYDGDRLEAGIVINSWQSGTTAIIQVQVTGGLVEISEPYFSSLKPKVGDCVKIWVKVWRERPFGDEHLVPQPNRNITPCVKGV